MLESLRRKTLDTLKGREMLTNWLCLIPVMALSHYNPHIAYAIIIGCGFWFVWVMWQIKKMYE